MCVCARARVCGFITGIGSHIHHHGQDADCSHHVRTPPAARLHIRTPHPGPLSLTPISTGLVFISPSLSLRNALQMKSDTTLPSGLVTFTPRNTHPCISSLWCFVAENPPHGGCAPPWFNPSLTQGHRAWFQLGGYYPEQLPGTFLCRCFCQHSFPFSGMNGRQYNRGLVWLSPILFYKNLFPQ